MGKIKNLVRRIAYGVPLYFGDSKKIKYLGNDYGGFYVDTFLLSRNPVVYSFGIGNDASFSLELIEKYNATVYAYDPSPDSIEWVKNNLENPSFHFFSYGLSDGDKTEKLYLPIKGRISASIQLHDKVSENNSVEVQMRTLTSLMHENNHERIDVLKVDIEGAEFKAMKDILSSGCDFTQLCIETHGRLFKNGWIKVRQMIALLINQGYICKFSNDYGNELLFEKK